MPIQVRIVQLGRGILHFQGDEGATLETGLAAVGLVVAGMEVRINGRPAPPDQPLTDGSLVTIVPLIKGGGRADRP